jgi:hypothetical protein
MDVFSRRGFCSSLADAAGDRGAFGNEHAILILE